MTASQIQSPHAGGTGQSAYSYDLVPYPISPFRQTHPDVLETVATFFGMTPAKPDHCRVLEIGCASGGNLVPMAEQLPGSQFIGIDLSERQINNARESAAALGLDNIDLQRCNIVDVDQEFGDFDYIICHGVFSWVPNDVQGKILDICRDRLKPNGVAYVSYNTYPGWYMRGMIRSMMLYHVRNISDPQQTIEQARALLRFLGNSVSDKDSAYGRLLKSELEMLSNQSDSYLFHDHLEKWNNPVYFYEFVELAERRNLKYLGEARLATMWAGNFPKDVTATLDFVAPNMIQREQYTDFLLNRTFRQTLLCHRGIALNRNLTTDTVANAFISGCLRPKDGGAEIDLTTTESVAFVDPSGTRNVTSGDPMVKAAMSHLSRSWPGSVRFEELVQASLLSLGDARAANASHDAEAVRQGLAANLLHLFLNGLVEVRLSPDRFVTEISGKPKASPFARYQAKSGNRRMTNRRHEVVGVDGFINRVTAEADGEKTRDDLLQTVQRLVQEGTLSITVTDGPADSLASDAARENVLKSCLEKALTSLANNAFLVS